MNKLPDEERQDEIIKEIEIADQKAREISKFATAIAQKWQQRMQTRRANKQNLTD